MDLNYKKEHLISITNNHLCSICKKGHSYTFGDVQPANGTYGYIRYIFYVKIIRQIENPLGLLYNLVNIIPVV